MDDLLAEDELAERADAPVEVVREFVGLGILQPEEGRFHRRDVMRTRVVAELEAKGIDRRQVAEALASGHLTLGYLESAGRRVPRSESTLADAASSLGLDVGALERTYVAFGIVPPAADERLREEDAEVVDHLRVLLEAGVGEGDVLRLARVWGDGVRRAAQYQTQFLHGTVEAVFRGRGLGDNEAFEAAIREVGVRVGRSGENLLTWLFRRHGEAFFHEHQFEHVEAALDEAGVRRRAERGSEAIVFADLSGYTRLTEEAGDAVAASVSLTLAQLTNEVAARHRGHVVKMLGDGVCFHFNDPADAVVASLEIVESVGPHDLPPAHVGVNAGPMINDEGDYFGRTVNIAARIASEAGPGEVLVGPAVTRVAHPDGVVFAQQRPATLKGVAEPVMLYRALRRAG